MRVVLIPAKDEFEIEVDIGQQAISRRIGNHIESRDCDYIVVVGESEFNYLKSVGRKVSKRLRCVRCEVMTESRDENGIPLCDKCKEVLEKVGKEFGKD